jgi:ATP-binding protein involved in chromosome partitioning
MSDQPERARILLALDAIKDPKSGHGLVSAGLVQGLVVAPGRAGFMMEVEAGDAALYEPVAAEAEAALKRIAGVERVQVVLTADRAPAPAPGTVRLRRGAEPEAAPASPRGRTLERPRAPTDHDHDHDHDHGHDHAHEHPPARAQPQAAAPMKPPHVAKVIAVASGKGGVGKSTVAVNLACGLALLGLRVGLLDADVYGPSIPQMTGARDEPKLGADRKLQPLEAWGLQIMSIGLLVEEASPMIWRGPMASSALNQMLNDVAWGSAEAPLDVLVIDMPPGTGDIQLTLAQKVALSGAVVVSTPQDVALIDVRRGVSMFEKTHVPILGVVENMAYFPDPTTGEPIAIFGKGGARAVAATLGAPFLGEVPIDQRLRQSCDDGRPFVISAPDSPTARALMGVATLVAERLAADADLKPPPRIILEA